MSGQECLVQKGVTRGVQSAGPQSQSHRPYRLAGGRETGIGHVGGLQDRILLVLIYP